jgi:ribosomal protein L40E
MSAYWIVVLIVLVLLLITASQHRRHAAETDPRMCRACGTVHPPFARFCRRCGKAIE